MRFWNLLDWFSVFCYMFLVVILVILEWGNWKLVSLAIVILFLTLEKLFIFIRGKL